MTSGWAPALVSAAAGLAILAGATARWVVETGSRQVGGVDIAEVSGVTGVQLRPELLLTGVVLIAAAVPLGLLRGRARRAVGALTGVVGIAGAALTVATLVDAATRPGEVQPSGWVVLAGCVVGAAAGWLAVRRPHRSASLPARFDLEERGASPERRDLAHPSGDPGRREPADEWTLATDESDER